MRVVPVKMGNFLLIMSWLACMQSPPRERRIWPAAEVPHIELLRQLTEELADPALDGREEGTEGSAVVQRMLVAQLRACGVAPAGEDGFLQRIRTGQGTNVLGRVRGTSEDPQVIVLSAHYDHQNHGWFPRPGAQDNAAGVAALLQVACGLASDPPARDVVVAFWDAEEPPTFLTDAMGSRYWHAHPTIPLAQVGAVVVLDLIGGGLWDGYGATFAFGAETSPEVVAAVQASAPPAPHRVHRASLSLIEDQVLGSRMVWSDYEVFRSAEVPVLFVSDGQNQRYHTRNDTADALDIPKLAAETRWLTAVARELAAGPPIRWSPVRTPAEDQATVRLLLTEALAASDVARWPPLAVGALRASQSTLAAGSGVAHRDVRAAAQRLMCWAGPYASRFTCGLL